VDERECRRGRARRDDPIYLVVSAEIYRGHRAHSEYRPALAHIPARRSAYAAYSALPPYPALIVGRFDPFRWAADPRWRSDLFDSWGERAPAGDAIAGFPGQRALSKGGPG
jgi:hypothetical protein